MLNWIRPRVVRLLRVPHDPEPPLGAPGSIRVFRAGRNFYYVRLARWLLAQVGAAIGILFSVIFISGLRAEYDAAQTAKAERQRRAAIVAEQPARAPEAAPAATPPAEFPKTARNQRNRAAAKQAFAERTPAWLIRFIEIAELAGIAGFLLQLPLTFAAVRLDWEFRWYIVTDRSLRIRAGLWSLQESTMSFANLQQVEVRQGPLQRLLGIADVRVQSAGGGGGAQAKGHSVEDSLHTGVFSGVEKAHEIRDLVLERLKAFRQAGLGDPDEAAAAPTTTPPPADASIAAARELLAEARALRQSLS